MHDSTLLLLLAGSFLPNNIALYVFKWIKRQLTPSTRSVKLINPKKYYILFESDPTTQYHYHKRMQKFWMANFIPMFTLVGLDIWASMTPGHTKLLSLLTAIMLALNTAYSLYANFDTETGDAHAAYASLKADEIQNSQSLPTEHDRQVTVPPALEYETA